MLDGGQVAGDGFSKLSQCSVLQRLDVHGCTSLLLIVSLELNLGRPGMFRVKRGLRLLTKFHLFCSHLIYLVNQSHFFERGSLRYVYFLCIYVYLRLQFMLGVFHTRSVNDRQFRIFRNSRLAVKK